MSELNLTTQNGQAVVSSRKVAEDFSKDHKHVIESIREILKAGNSALTFFYESTYKVTGNNKTYPEYLMNRDGFTLLAMGFTGQAALEWKIKYVQAFNEMEKQLDYSQTKLTPQPRYRARMISTAVKDVDATAKQLMKLFAVKDGIAYAAAVNMVEQTYQINMAPVKKMLPAAEHETGFLNPTDIGKRIGKKAAETNLFLVEKGLQAKIDGAWRLTDEGKQYAEEIPYNRNGHSGYQIQWNETVIDALLREEA